MSPRSSRPVSPDLAAANATLDLCAALLRAQGDAAPAPRDKPAPAPMAMPTRDPEVERDAARLEALATAIGSVTQTYRGDGQSGVAASAIADCAAQAIAIARDVLAAKASNRPAAAADITTSVEAIAPRRDYATERALRAALDRYFGFFEVPGTSWRLDWRLLGDANMPSATAFASSPGNIESSYSIALPDKAPWRTATKLAALEAAVKKTIAIVTGGGAKPTSPGKYFLSAISWSAGAGSITLSRSKKKLAAAVRIDYPGDGTLFAVPLDALGNAAGPQASQDGDTTRYLDALWWKISAEAMGLVHQRGNAIAITHEGTAALALAEPARLAEVLMDANEELLSKVDGEIDAEMRAVLASKFDDVPERYRARLDGLVLARGSNPPARENPPALAPVADEAAAISEGEPKTLTDESSTQTATFDPQMKTMLGTPVAAPVKRRPPRKLPERVTKPIVAQPTPMPEAADLAEPTSADEEPTKSTRISQNVFARRSPIGSGPIPNPGRTARMVVSRPNDLGAPLFGQKTLDEKFEGLDLEIDWDDEDDDAPTQSAARLEAGASRGRDDETLPGVTPSARRPTTITVAR